MNAVTRQEAAALPALQMPEAELMQVLQSSLYPGASISSIKMVLGYCRASGLDPMQKPVHIVPMWDGKAKQMRDVVMPGIGRYRTQAARTGEHAGISEPVFGPDVTDKIGGQQITYPQWCLVTVKRRLPSGEIAEFPAKEFWLENYAVKGGQEKSVAPNAMWTKRPYGQIAKCAEAQALRKAFPEVGAEATAEEMDGKQFDDFTGTTIDATTGEVQPPSPPPPYPQAEFDAKLPAWLDAIAKGKATADAVIARASTKHPLTDAQKAAIRKPKAPAPAEAPAAPGATYAEVADRLAKATTTDKLEEAADLIAAVADAGQQKELHDLYQQRVATLTPKE